MASIWDSRYMIESLTEDYDEHFKKESDNSLVIYYKVKGPQRSRQSLRECILKGLYNSSKKAVTYKDALQITVAAWEYISQFEVITNADQVS